MLLTQSLYELLVHWFITVVCENAKESLPLVQSLGRLVKTTGQTVVDESGLQHLLKKQK